MIELHGKGLGGITEDQLLFIIANEGYSVSFLSKNTGLTGDQIHDAYKEVFDRGMYQELSQKALKHKFIPNVGDDMTFQDRLTLLINKNKSFMSVEKMADGMGLTKNTLYKQLDGGRKPQKATVDKIAEYFRVSPEWLLCGG